ncbi:MAG: HDIG domain-containing protein [Bacteroidales bacterium]|nr:HDIG domain-containing protein [Bacteroidales bacterium]
MVFDSLIEKYFPAGSKSYHIYIEHVSAVARTVSELCRRNRHLNIDEDLAVKGAMLHDLGICMVDAPKIECFGFMPYIQHGIIGRLILEDEGLPEYALFCERHIGTGMYIEDIIANKMPLPVKDMYPLTMEEKVVAYADKFFSKSKGKLSEPKDIEEIKKGIASYGARGTVIFSEWEKLFGVNIQPEL